MTGLVAGALALPAVAVAAPGAPVQLQAADVALFNGVRQAGLWEMPAGQMAKEKGNLKRVREVGAEIAKQHERLDQLAVDAANKLGVQLPAEASELQQGWIKEMKDASGARFDQIFVDRLRAAHGGIFPVIAAVRAGTRNEVVRQLAADSNDFVLEHMRLLESTGLVKYKGLPPVEIPAPPNDSVLAAARANGVPGGGINSAMIWIVLLAALAVGAVATMRVFRSR